MKPKFRVRQIVWMPASGKRIMEMVVVSYSNGFYVLRYRDSGGGIRVRESRIYATKEEAEKAVGKSTAKKEATEEGVWTPQADEKYYI